MIAAVLTTWQGFRWVSWFRKSLIAQIIAGIVCLGGVWKLNNYYVAKKAIANVVQASKKEGAKRNAKVSSIRRSTKPSTAGKRLLDYARPD